MSTLPWPALLSFLAAALLLLFLLYLLLRSRRGGRLFVLLSWLLGMLLVWHGGNFLLLLLQQLRLPRGEVLEGALQAASFLGLSTIPPLLLHTHWQYYREHFPPGPREERIIPRLLGLLYASLLPTPFLLIRLLRPPFGNPLQELSSFILPYLGLLALSYYASAWLGVGVLRKSANPIERALFRWLVPLFLLIPLFNLVVFRYYSSGPLSYHNPWILATFVSALAPCLVVTYYICRYGFLQVRVGRAVAYTLLILGSVLLYLAGIRRLAPLVQQRLEAPAQLVEGLFLVALFLLFPLLSGWLEHQLERFFSGEIRRFRETGEAFRRAGNRLLDTELLREFMEEKLRRDLGLPEIRIRLGPGVENLEGPFRYPLDTGSRVIGALEVGKGAASLSRTEQEGLRLLAGEIAAVLEHNQILEEKLRMQREMAYRSRMEELGRMAGAVAHSVKNPLSSMKTLLQLLGEGENLTSEQRRDIALMLEEIDRLARTVSELLHSSRPGFPDKSPPVGQLLNLEDLLASLAAIFRGELEARGVRLHWELEPSLTIRTDPDALRDILSNLLSNALEASPPGGLVLVQGHSREGTICLQIQDQGAGIPPEIRNHLFQPFLTTKPHGNGLGLALVRKRLQQLGGSVSWESPLPGGGTLFEIRLPASFDKGPFGAVEG